MAVRFGAHLSWLSDWHYWHLRNCTLQRFQATVYKQALKLPRSTSNLLVFLEMGRYPMQIQWLQRTLSYLLEQNGSQQSQQ
jgi:hypothetical protein